MTDAFHDRAGEIFLQAIELPTESRTAFVENACAGDTALIDEVNALIYAHDAPLPILDEPSDGAVGELVTDDDDRFIGSRFGAFQIISTVASGGMGVVYRAEQDQPRRIVAIKLLRRGLSGRSAVRRFQFEVQALGRLQHPGIAQIFEAGVESENGVSIPYFAMEYVEGGRSITTFAGDQRLTIRQQLSLVAQVCDAVHSGHQKGIIHRDLKPDNILVNAQGQPKVIDFGVASATDADIQVTTQHSEIGRLIGTLPYMSPEQLSGDPGNVDTRADVYALGVVLYELLAGRLPIPGPWDSLIDAIHEIREQSPQRLGSIDASLRGDIETIIAKAIEKDKSRRYQSAAELAADIRRFLSDEPISARPPTAIYQMRMFARRNRGLVRGAALGAAALLIGVIVSVQQAIVATSARDLARREQAQVQYQSYLAGIAAAAAALENHDVPLARRSLERTPESLRGWEWRHLKSRLDQSLLAIRDEDRPSRARICFLDEDVIGAWSAADSVWVCWDANTGAQLPDRPVSGRVLSNTAGTVQITLGSDKFTIQKSDADPPLTVRFSDIYMPADADVHLSDNGRWLSANTLSKAALFDLESRKGFNVALTIWPVGVAPSAVSDFGQFAVGTGLNGKPAVWNAGEDALRPLMGATAAGNDLVYDPTNTRIAAVLNDATVRLWDAESAVLLATGHGHTNNAIVVRFSPDGTLIATAGRDRTLRLWSADTLEPLAVLHGHDDSIMSLEFDDTGTQIVTAGAGADRSIRVWDVSTHGGRNVLRGHSAYVYPVAVSPDGATIASGAWDNEIRLWDADRMTAGKRLLGHTSYLISLEFSSDGGRLLSFGADKMLRVWDVASGVEISSRPRESASARLTWHPDGVHVYLPRSGTDGMTLWNTETGDTETQPFERFAEIKHGPVSANGRFAVTETDGQYRVFRTRDAQLALPIAIGQIFALGAGESENHLATIRLDDLCVVDVWDLDTRERIGTLRGHSGRSIWDIAFSPDGSRIVTAGDDQVIRIWDATTMDEILQLRGHTSYVWSLAFRPDGTQLISGSGDGTVRVWDSLSSSVRRQSQK